MRRPDDGLIEFRLLGPVEAVRGDRAVALGGPRQRALLALLLMESGRPIAADRLAEELWDGRPPKGSATTMRAYVSKLRATVGTGAEISARTSGYALEVAPERVDVRCFERLVREGHEALAHGSARRAADRLREALELWRGLPFAGLGDEGILRDEAARLVELRLLALEDRIEADLALGRNGELVDELERLLGDHPFRERLWRQLMLALYRADRQADALFAYTRARQALVAELGLEPGEELKLLEQAILRHEVPRVQRPEARHNLPSPITSFVGREAELADLERLLGEGRLVTLTGVGGAGKTRLALEAAARSVADRRDGVVFVDFSALAEPELVPGQVAAALEVREQPDSSVVEQLKRRLREAELLLVLDNCEHLREACATVSHDLLVACPGLQILATSRQLLGVAGEVDYPVPPLAIPTAGADSDELRSSEAVRLFLARAREARPLLEDDDRSVLTAALICRDLDGLPLAIELAAARAKALSLDDIATRLADRFRFLVSWRRLSPARHRTLRETMDWSYELLSETERSLLARLSVFAGGCTLSGAAAVCLDDDADAAVGLIGRLVDASLVLAEERDGGMRYGLLETVRQYCAERLEENGETALLQRRHAEFFVSFAENAIEIHLTRLDKFVTHVEDELGNLRSALAWSRDSDERTYLARLATAVWQFWWVRGELSEGRAWLENALGGLDELDPVLGAGVAEGAASLAWASGDLSRVAELAGTAQALFAAVGDRRGECGGLTLLGHVALAQEDFVAAEAWFKRARESAEEMSKETRSGFVAMSMHNLGSVALGEGSLTRAAERYETALSIFAEAADSYGVALSELALGLVAMEAGRHGDAAEYMRRALPVFREMGFRQYTTQCLEGIAIVAFAGDDADEAARLLGAADALHELVGHAPVVVLPQRREQAIASIRAQLGELLFAAAWSEGQELTEAEALDRAQRSVGG